MTEPGPGAHVVIVSDRAYRGERPDGTAPALTSDLVALGYTLGERSVSVVPDERALIVAELRRLVADPRVRLVLTSGGTGAAPRDVTPEATREVLERELPGFGELMRRRSLESTVLASGSRAVAGTARDTLIINLPGSPRGARECWEFVAVAARHVLDLIAGGVADCAPEAPR